MHPTGCGSVLPAVVEMLEEVVVSGKSSGKYGG